MLFSTFLTSNQTHLYLLQMLSNILEELLEKLGIGEYSVVDVLFAGSAGICTSIAWLPAPVVAGITMAQLGFFYSSGGLCVKNPIFCVITNHVIDY